MVRNYKRKTEKGRTAKKCMEEAVRKVIENRQSVRSTAIEFDLCHQTVNRHVQNVMNRSQVNVRYTKSRWFLAKPKNWNYHNIF